MNTKFSRLPGSDKAIMIFAYTILGLFMAAIILPMVYIILASFIDPITLQNSGLTFDFSKWTLTAYERVLTNAQIWTGFKNAMIYSVLFTIISVTVTLLAAYPMSRPDFKGKGFFNVMFVITMFFGGGLIPTYLLISDLGMLDTIWAILIPGAFSVRKQLKLMVQPKWCISSRFCCHCVHPLLPPLLCGSLWVCGTATLMP